ncbi:hypothetical protein CQ054_23025 [Ochrobactrum sp. MYb29]|nr:hypothetical protein CQ054_23025 [Ochrobactrum sp. MYb29]
MNRLTDSVVRMNMNNALAVRGNLTEQNLVNFDKDVTALTAGEAIGATIPRSEGPQVVVRAIEYSCFAQLPLQPDCIACDHLLKIAHGNAIE